MSLATTSPLGLGLESVGGLSGLGGSKVVPDWSYGGASRPAPSMALGDTGLSDMGQSYLRIPGVDPEPSDNYITITPSEPAPSAGLTRSGAALTERVKPNSVSFAEPSGDTVPPTQATEEAKEQLRKSILKRAKTDPSPSSQRAATDTTHLSSRAPKDLARSFSRAPSDVSKSGKTSGVSERAKQYQAAKALKKADPTATADTSKYANTWKQLANTLHWADGLGDTVHGLARLARKDRADGDTRNYILNQLSEVWDAAKPLYEKPSVLSTARNVTNTSKIDQSTLATTAAAKTKLMKYAANVHTLDGVLKGRVGKDVSKLITSYFGDTAASAPTVPRSKPDSTLPANRSRYGPDDKTSPGDTKTSAVRLDQDTLQGLSKASKGGRSAVDKYLSSLSKPQRRAARDYLRERSEKMKAKKSSGPTTTTDGAPKAVSSDTKPLNQMKRYPESQTAQTSVATVPPTTTAPQSVDTAKIYRDIESTIGNPNQMRSYVESLSGPAKDIAMRRVNEMANANKLAATSGVSQADPRFRLAAYPTQANATSLSTVPDTGVGGFVPSEGLSQNNISAFVRSLADKAGGKTLTEFAQANVNRLMANTAGLRDRAGSVVTAVADHFTGKLTSRVDTQAWNKTEDGEVRMYEDEEFGAKHFESRTIKDGVTTGWRAKTFIPFTAFAKLGLSPEGLGFGTVAGTGGPVSTGGQSQTLLESVGSTLRNMIPMRV